MLRAKGFLASRTGSGSYVTVPAGSRPRPSLARWNVSGLPDTETIDLSCAALPAPPGVIEAAVTSAATAIAAQTSGDGYDPAGLPELRELVAARYAGRGVATNPDQIVLTNGALHGWDL